MFDDFKSAPAQPQPQQPQTPTAAPAQDLLIQF
jgi:hypothetical protein